MVAAAAAARWAYPHDTKLSSERRGGAGRAPPRPAHYVVFGGFAAKAVARLDTPASRVPSGFRFQRFSIVVRIELVSCST